MSKFDGLSPQERRAVRRADWMIATFEMKETFRKSFRPIDFPDGNVQRFAKIEAKLEAQTPEKPLERGELAKLACEYFDAAWGCSDPLKVADAHSLMAGAVFSSRDVEATSVQLANGRVVYSDPALFAEGAYSLLGQAAKERGGVSRQLMADMLQLASHQYLKAGCLNLWKDAQSRLIEVIERMADAKEALFERRIELLAGTFIFPRLLTKRETRWHCRKALRLLERPVGVTDKLEMIESVASAIDAWQRSREKTQRVATTGAMPTWLRVFKRRCVRILPAMRAQLPAEAFSTIVNKIFPERDE